MVPQSNSAQVIVLTGATSGVGLCTAQLAAQSGARLVLLSRTSGTLGSVIGLVRSLGGDAIEIIADVTVRDDMVAAAQAAAKHFGGIDTWINNAGMSIYGRLDQVTEDESRHLFDINFWGVVNGSLAALPYLAARGGSLINVGSEMPTDAAPMQGMYATSKHAVKGFTDSLRAEVEQGGGPRPVSITLVQPGALQADASRAADPQAIAQAIIAAACKRGSASAASAVYPFWRPPRPATMLPAASPTAKHA